MQGGRSFVIIVNFRAKMKHSSAGLRLYGRTQYQESEGKP